MSTDSAAVQTSKATSIPPFVRALLGLFLLVPACGLCSANMLMLTLNTFTGSLQDSAFFGEGDFVGMENYARLFETPGFSSAFGYTSLVIFVHVLLATLIPPILAIAIYGLSSRLRQGARLFFTLPLAFFGPALLMLGPGYLRGLWSIDSANRAYLLVTSLAGLAIACAAGVIVYSAILRGRNESSDGSRPVLAPMVITWLVVQLATAAYVLQSFNVLSGLLPNRGGVPLGRVLHQTVVTMQLGMNSAISTVILLFVALLGIVATLLIVLGRLQLSYQARSETDQSTTPSLPAVLRWVALLIGGAAVLVAVVLPLLLSLIRIFPALGDDLFGSLNVSILRVWVNSILPALLMILLVQLPVAYLGALGLGVTRPLGRGSPWLLLLFSPWLFVTSMPLTFAAFQNLRKLEIVDTFLALAPPLLLNIPMLFLLTLFFMGQEPKWRKAREEGTPAAKALFQQLIVPSLPLAGFLAVLSLLVASQDLIVPLMMGISAEQLTFSTAILRVSASARPGSSAPLIALFGIPYSLIFFVLFAALQMFYLDRLTLTRRQDDPRQ